MIFLPISSSLSTRSETRTQQANQISDLELLAGHSTDDKVGIPDAEPKRRLSFIG